MRTKLTQFEIDSFHLNGHVAIHDFLDDDEVAQWRRNVESIAGEPAAVGLSNMRGRNVSWVNPVFAAMWRTPEIGSLVGHLYGFDGVRHLVDGTSFVLPGHKQTEWHCNMHESMPVDTREAVNFYVPLDEFRWYNKANVFLPGAHKIMPLGVRTVTPTMRKTTFDEIFTQFPELRTIEPDAPEGRAGMVVLYNPLGVHGSAPNMTPRTRRMTSAVFIGDHEVWNGFGDSDSIYAQDNDRFAGLRPGDRFTDTAAPLIWRRAQ